MRTFIARGVALLLVAAVVLVVAGCDSNDNNNRDLNGTWNGLGSSGGGQVQLTLNLTDTNGAVTGTAVLVTNQSFNLTAVGTFDDPKLDISITGGPTAAAFDARMADNGDTIAGSLTGVGNPVTIALKRQ